jgi:hypothetical protein
MVLRAALAGCAGDDPDAARTAEATSATSEVLATSESPGASDAPSVATPLEGEWSLKQTEQDVVRHLRHAGFGQLVERFLRVEGVIPEDNWRWPVTGDRFVANWQNADGSWKVADFGTFEVVDDTMVLKYAGVDGNATTFEWRIVDDQLWLDWVDYEGKMYKGLPDEAFWRAYLTKPLTRTA